MVTQVAAAEQRLRRRADARQLGLAVHAAGQVLRQRALRRAVRLPAPPRTPRSPRAAGMSASAGIVRRRRRRCSARTGRTRTATSASGSRNTAPFSLLPYFFPSAFGQQRRGQAVDGLALQPPDQVDARDDVAPLVRRARSASCSRGAGAARGSRTPAAACTRTRCTRSPPRATRSAGLHRVALDHLVDREVLADVAQELEQLHAAQPVEVVDDPDRRPLVVGEEAPRPARCSRRVLSRSSSSSSSFRSLLLPDGSPIIPVAPPTSGMHLVAVPPQVRHHHQRHQVAGVQAGRRRVEARVDRDRLRQHLAMFSAVVCWTRPRQDSSSNAPMWTSSLTSRAGRDKKRHRYAACPWLPRPRPQVPSSPSPAGWRS